MYMAIWSEKRELEPRVFSFISSTHSCVTNWCSSDSTPPACTGTVGEWWTSVVVDADWRKWDLLTVCILYSAESLGANNEAAASLSVCLPGPRSHRSHVPFNLFIYPEMADGHTQTHTDWQKPLEWAGWQLASFDTGCLLCCSGVPPSRMLSPLKSPHLQTTSPKAGGRTSVAFPFDRLLFQHMSQRGGGGKWGGSGQLSTQVMWVF